MAVGNIYDAVHPLDVPRPHIMQMNMSHCVEFLKKGHSRLVLVLEPRFSLSGHAEPRFLSSRKLEDSSLSHVNLEVSHLPFSALLSSAFILFRLLLFLAGPSMLPSGFSQGCGALAALISALLCVH